MLKKEQCLNLGEWAEKQIRLGNEEIVKYILSLLPEEKKPAYRELWIRVKKDMERE